MYSYYRKASDNPQLKLLARSWGRVSLRLAAYLSKELAENWEGYSLKVEGSKATAIFMPTSGGPKAIQLSIRIDSEKYLVVVTAYLDGRPVVSREVLTQDFEASKVFPGAIISPYAPPRVSITPPRIRDSRINGKLEIRKNYRVFTIRDLTNAGKRGENVPGISVEMGKDEAAYTNLLQAIWTLSSFEAAEKLILSAKPKVYVDVFTEDSEDVDINDLQGDAEWFRNR